MRSGFRIGRALVGEWTGRNARARAQLDGTKAAILTYHRILPSAEAQQAGVEPGMFVDPETFERQLQWLAQDFQVLPLGEIVTALAEGSALPDGACAITFDDGWLDNYTHAWPILKRASLPATVFLVGSRVGTNGAFWTDEIWPAICELSAARCTALMNKETDSPRALLEALKVLRPTERANAIGKIRADLQMPPSPDVRELMNWAEVEEMNRGGVCFECHGQSHDLLTTLEDAEIAAELEASQQVLQSRGLGQERILAYPNGSWDERVASVAKAQGIRAAVTTERGLAESAHASHALPRISVHDDVSRTRACFRRLIPIA
ncbi:MAG: polysaccharide deacetylase family protein [Myxococcota bacterium]